LLSGRPLFCLEVTGILSTFDIRAATQRRCGAVRNNEQLLVLVTGSDLIFGKVAMPFLFTQRTVLAVLLLAATTVTSDAQSAGTLNSAQPYTVPQTQELSVSPGNPNTAPGSTLGSAGTNPITGKPCLGQGSTATTSGSNTLPGNGASGIIGSC
jgi:hypothetical protein